MTMFMGSGSMNFSCDSVGSAAQQTNQLSHHVWWLDKDGPVFSVVCIF